MLLWIFLGDVFISYLYVKSYILKPCTVLEAKPPHQYANEPVGLVYELSRGSSLQDMMYGKYGDGIRTFE